MFAGMSSKEAYRFDGYEHNDAFEYEIKSTPSSTKVRSRICLLIGMVFAAAIITALVIIFVG